MMTEVDSVERVSMFRSRKDILEEKDLKSGFSSATWFLSGNVWCVVSCQANPEGKLAEMLRTSIGTTTKVVVKEGGIPMTLGLNVTDPYKKDTCQCNNPECWI